MGLGVAMEPVEHAAVLRLALLAPDIIERILEGRGVGTLLLESPERPLPLSGEEHRKGRGQYARLQRLPEEVVLRNPPELP
jgi:hypothetical protein